MSRTWTLPLPEERLRRKKRDLDSESSDFRSIADTLGQVAAKDTLSDSTRKVLLKRRAHVLNVARALREASRAIDELLKGGVG